MLMLYCDNYGVDLYNFVQSISYVVKTSSSLYMLVYLFPLCISFVHVNSINGDCCPFPESLLSFCFFHVVILVGCIPLLHAYITSRCICGSGFYSLTCLGFVLESFLIRQYFRIFAKGLQ